jgi:hypothetical protein
MGKAWVRRGRRTGFHGAKVAKMSLAVRWHDERVREWDLKKGEGPGRFRLAVPFCGAGDYTLVHDP